MATYKGLNYGSGEEDSTGANPSRANGNGDRDVAGKFVRGNTAALQHGLYAMERSQTLRAEVEAFKAGIVADLGGDAELSTLERAYVDRLGEVDLTLRLMREDIARRGLLTPAGGVRRIYDELLAGVDRWDRLAQRLGVRRRTKQVESAADIVQQYRSREDAR